MSKPTKDELAKHLLRARWIIGEFEKLHPGFESLYVIFMDGALESHYGKEELQRLYTLAPAPIA